MSTRAPLGKNYLGAKTPVHPITGEAVRDKDTILDLAERHGWDRSVNKAYLGALEARLTKDEHHIDLTLTSSYSILSARVHNGDAYIPSDRAQVERVLTGTPCTCTRVPGHYFAFDGDQAPSLDCDIHKEA